MRAELFEPRGASRTPLASSARAICVMARGMSWRLPGAAPSAADAAEIGSRQQTTDATARSRAPRRARRGIPLLSAAGGNPRSGWRVGGVGGRISRLATGLASDAMSDGLDL